MATAILSKAKKFDIWNLHNFLSSYNPFKYKYTKGTFLIPSSNVTNLGYYNSFFKYSEKHFHSIFNRYQYLHDGREPIEFGAQELRLYLSCNIYAAKEICKKQVTMEQVENEWHLFRHMIEEAGCINPNTRHNLLDINYYEGCDFKNFSDEVKQSIKEIISGDLSYFKEKIPLMETWKAIVSKVRQERLWPFEFEHLKKQSVDVVEYDLEKRGYLYELMERELIEKSESPMTKEEVKIKILESLRFTDKDTLEACIRDFNQDMLVLSRHGDLYDLKETMLKFEKLKKETAPMLEAVDNVETEEEAEALLKQINDSFLDLLRPHMIELVKSQYTDRLDYFEQIGYFEKKYINSNSRTIGKDHFNLYRYFISGDNLFPITKVLAPLYATVFAIFYITFCIRRRRFEKKHGVMLGNRSRYLFSRKDRVKNKEDH